MAWEYAISQLFSLIQPGIQEQNKKLKTDAIKGKKLQQFNTLIFDSLGMTNTKEMTQSHKLSDKQKTTLLFDIFTRNNKTKASTNIIKIAKQRVQRTEKAASLLGEIFRKINIHKEMQPIQNEYVNFLCTIINNFIQENQLPQEQTGSPEYLGTALEYFKDNAYNELEIFKAELDPYAETGAGARAVVDMPPAASQPLHRDSTELNTHCD